MENIYEEIYNKNKILIDIAIEKTKKLDNDLLHFIGHTYDVINYIKELLERIEANKEVCIIAAYWHDVGRTVVDEGHEEESGKMLKQEMQRLGYDDKMIEQDYTALDEIIEQYLPILKDEILKLDYSKELFERDMNLYIRDYLKVIEDKKNNLI